MESSVVRLLRVVLRAHGHDADQNPLRGRPVTATSWEPGNDDEGSCRLGRITAEHNSSNNSSSGSSTVYVDFCDASDRPKAYNVESLAHTDFYHVASLIETDHDDPSAALSHFTAVRRRRPSSLSVAVVDLLLKA